MTIIVDPILIAIPYQNTNQVAVREYAQRLLEWHKFFSINLNLFVVSSQAISAMYTFNCAPTVQKLEQLFLRFDIEDVSARDIVESCQRVMENYPHMEERAEASEIDCDDGNIQIIPFQLYERLHPEIGKAFVKSLITTSYALKILEGEPWRLATAPLAENASTHAKVEGTILDKNLATSFSGQWELIFEPNSLEFSIPISTEADLYFLVEMAWKRINSNIQNLNGIDRSRFRFGPNFITTLLQKIQRRSGERRQKDLDRVFEAIVFVLEDIWTYGSDKHHALRPTLHTRTRPPQTRQRTVDSNRFTDRAARVEVVAGTRPLHLHYWQCYDQTYEWANITDDHDDATIF